MIIGTKENFDKEINGEKVLVDFNATWCGPCRMLKPIIEEFSNNKNIKVISVDVDDEGMLARNYGVMSIPCLILFEKGIEVNRSVGLMSYSDLEKFVGE